MSIEATATNRKPGLWHGGRVPLGASYGKLMMWFFLLSDAFTFSALLVSYGFFRTTARPGWINPEEVFQGIPWLVEGAHIGSGHPAIWPLVFVGIMTFILIFSSVTMVLAVEAGHRMDQKTVGRYMIYTILGGIAFLTCQAMEWSHLILAENLTVHNNPFPVAGAAHGGENASLLFGQLFFAITGFHGFHVFSGVVINIIMYFKNANGDFLRTGHYEMIEKAGLYWHFVDLVWVFVFTLFYLI
ncbi:MAG: cytochrome oxidase subunit III [Sphingobacteriales bacterium]|nr:MAG: cytochrome oxidase subunit III [Sphingobacteriales bacterium]